MASKTILLCCCALLLSTRTVLAERLTFDSAEAWETWEAPYGLIQVGEQGQLQLVKYRKEINAVADAPLFTHVKRSQNKEVAGGIWEASSSPGTAGNLIDGKPETYWQPDPDDPLDEWTVQIDLGRATLAQEIRLTFPDEEGARPFRQFSIFLATGYSSIPTDDLFIFHPVYRTTKPNEETSIVIPLQFDVDDSTMVIDPDLELDPAYKNQYRLFQYLGFVAEEQNEGAALAEIEVAAVGDNVSIGTNQRGWVIDGLTAVSNINLFDADMNTNNSIAPVYLVGTTWKSQGTWFYADLGAVFWVDEMFMYVLKPQEGSVGWLAQPPKAFAIWYSDGTHSIGTELPVPEPFDYEELITQIMPSNVDGPRYQRFLFKPRRMRYLFWHAVSAEGWLTKLTEMMIFSPGHPAKVLLGSPFIDLGKVAGDERPKIISALHWDADLPPNTRLQLRSRSGNTMEEMYTFYDKKGTAVTEEKWLSSPKVIRGPVDTTVVVGEDWGAWSNLYQSSGEPFQSESPRRFVQLEMILSTDDPQVAPVVNSLSIEYEEALLQEARGSVLPRQATPNLDTRFTYTLWPGADDQDSGFDILRFSIPDMAEVKDVEVQIGDSVIEPAQITIEEDSLLISLPQSVLVDSMRTRFTTRVLSNATVFSLDLGSSDRPGLWQSVEPAERRSNIVMLPELTDSNQLIGDLEISQVFTPNGDGVNDQLEIGFVPFKVMDVEPRVQIYDLSGRLVAEPERTSAGARWTFSWSGLDLAGSAVAPGVYLCRIDLEADAGKDIVLRAVAVTY